MTAITKQLRNPQPMEDPSFLLFMEQPLRMSHLAASLKSRSLFSFYGLLHQVDMKMSMECPIISSNHFGFELESYNNERRYEGV